MAIQDPLAVFCALLDRSVQQIAEASADARVFDRNLIVRISDVWDNNTFPLFHAAVGTGEHSSEAQAQTGLLWMAEFRREWMVEQAAIAGYALAEKLPPARYSRPYRDYAGRVRPWSHPLTADVIEEVAADYDLAAARVTYFQIERAGRRLDATINLSAPRRFLADTSAPARIMLGLVDVTDLQVTADLRGTAVAATDEGVLIDLGGRGYVRAASGDLYIDDPGWHLSAAGHRADAEAPKDIERSERPQVKAKLSPLAEAAAKSLHSTMIGIRIMRYPQIIDLAAVAERCERYAEAGTMLLDAARQPRSRRRKAILRQLAAAGQPPLDIPSKALPARRPTEPTSELRMVAYTAAHERYTEPVEEGLLRHYAVPPDAPLQGDGRWSISVLKDPEPSTFAVRTEDFRTRG